MATNLPEEHSDSNINPDPVYQHRSTVKILGGLSMALGLATVALGFLPFIGWLSFIPGMIGVVMGIFGIIQASKYDLSARLSVTGIILSVAGMVLFVIIQFSMDPMDMTGD